MKHPTKKKPAPSAKKRDLTLPLPPVTIPNPVPIAKPDKKEIA